MSTTIQTCLWNRKLYPSYSSTNPFQELGQKEFVRTLYGDRYFVDRLQMQKELEGHQGCVNSLCWSQRGDKLLSGSDDQTLRIWHPFSGDYRNKTIIRTGHRDNVFAAKFMPSTADQIIVSAAGDSEIRIFDLDASTSNEQLRHIYTCHSDPVKRIGTEPNNPHEFLTCSEDGTVRHFDLRQPHICTPHYVRSFNTATRLRAREYTSQHRTISPRPLRQGCPRPLLDYSQYGLDINSMTINRFKPQYFVIAGMDNYIYLHDRRMIHSSTASQGAGKNRDRSPGSQCLLRFTPSGDHIRRKQGNQYVTACKFSDANGYELLGSWAARGIYLFNILDSPTEARLGDSGATFQPQPKVRSSLSLYTASSSSPSLQSQLDFNQSDDDTFTADDDDDEDNILNGKQPSHRKLLMAADNRERVIQALEQGNLPQALRLVNEHYLYLQHEGGGNESSIDFQTGQQKETTQLEHTWIHCMTAVIFSVRVMRGLSEHILNEPNSDDNDTNHNNSDDTNSNIDNATIQRVKDDLAGIRVQLSRAKEMAPKNWKGMWMIAVTHWLICGGDDDVVEQRKRYLSGLKTKHPESLETTANLAYYFPGVSKYMLLASQFATRTRVLFDRLSTSDRSDLVAKGQGRSVTDYYTWMEHLSRRAYRSYESLINDDSIHDNGDNDDDDDDDDAMEIDDMMMRRNNFSKEDLDSTPQHMDWLRLLYPFPPPLTPTKPISPIFDIDMIDQHEFNNSDDLFTSLVTSEENTTSNDANDDSGIEQDNGSNRSNSSDDYDYSYNLDDDDDDDNNYIISDDYEDDDWHSTTGFFDTVYDDTDIGENQLDELECHQRAIRTDFQSDVGVISHRMKYDGHGNIRTIKDVNFYGAQDEYVMSGSDDGNVFLWDKKTGKIVQILKADQDTVNVVHGHPSLPYLAASGIDNTIKLFSPTGPSTSSQMHLVDDIVGSNRRYHVERQRESFLTRSLLESMSRMFRQRHLLLDHSDDDDDDDDDSFEYIFVPDMDVLANIDRYGDDDSDGL